MRRRLRAADQGERRGDHDKDERSLVHGTSLAEPPGTAARLLITKEPQYRIASIGLTRTATRAGSSPASAPTAVETTRPRIAAETGKGGTSCTACATNPSVIGFLR